MEKHHEYAAELMRLLREHAPDLPDYVRHAIDDVERASLSGDDKKLIAAADSAADAAAEAYYAATNAAYYAAAYAYAANAVAASNAAAFAVEAGVPSDRVQKLRALLDV